MLSGVLLIPLIVFLAWWEFSAVLLVIVATSLAIHELYGVLAQGGITARRLLGITTGVLICLAAALESLIPFDLFGAVICLTIVLSLGYELIPRDRTTSLTSWAFTYAGAVYIGVLMATLIRLRLVDTPLEGGWLAFAAIPPGMAWIIFTLAITWCQDSAAYFVGRSFGRTRMAPVLSPKKSWEGAAGGLIASALTAMLCVPLLGLPISLGFAALIGALAGVVGPIGDLAESLIKRQIGIKDSGSLIPGHGGMLDRIDSLIFIAPLVYYMVLLTLFF
ncbi:MAG: phosphatidate cytidylyltransferase [Oscillochloris sp.]|nr:phosphatidate cytidylyltransferase [Oscillochloris sp.]